MYSSSLSIRRRALVFRMANCPDPSSAYVIPQHSRPLGSIGSGEDVCLKSVCTKRPTNSRHNPCTALDRGPCHGRQVWPGPGPFWGLVAGGGPLNACGWKAGSATSTSPAIWGSEGNVGPDGASEATVEEKEAGSPHEAGGTMTGFLWYRFSGEMG